MSYQVYLTESQSLEDIATALKKISKAKVTKTKSVVTVAFGAWKVRVVDSTESWVAEEAKELAQRCKQKDKKELLKKSARRLEIELDNDPSDKYYNEGLYVFEALYVLSGAVGLDPVSGEFY